MKTDDMEKTVLEIVSSATLSRLEQGMGWYRAAYVTAQDISVESGLPFDVVARVIAALSPRCRWDKNVRDARAACMARSADGLTGVLGRSKRAANEALRGSQALSGQKVQRFYKAIKGDDQAVVVDAWTFRALGGLKDAPTKKEYKACVSAFVRASLKLDIPPRELQAIVWVVGRGSAE